jgi:DNA-binding winged helix-turn-helix (wHTH) protein/tetratricopeptide (TPR) repeat protein
MASDGTTSSNTVRFGDDFELDLHSYELRRSRQTLKLERIPTELLCLLVQRRGELVTRDQIVDRVWGKEVFLDTDNSINAAIRKIRQVLGDDPARPRFVQTLTGRGYRFVAPVEEACPPAGAKVEALRAVSQTETLLGRRVSHYRVIRLLGGGGMGVVFEAEDLKLGRRVALKFLPAELGRDAAAFERLEREARAASSLDHHNICSIYLLGEYEGNPFIVMPLLEGQTLREWIERTEKQSPHERTQQLVELGIQIADGLEAAHQKGIIHRDIKPANIFVTNGGEAKILDFGVAKFLEAPEGGAEPAGPRPNGDSTTKATLTRTGASAGTPSYLSPEQIRGEKLDARTDLFSLGLVLHEMATGERAFGGDITAVIRDSILHFPAPPSRQLNPAVPPELEKIISKALEKDRESRYQTARALRVDLEKMRVALNRAAADRRPGGWWALGGVAAALLALTASGVIYRGRLFRDAQLAPPAPFKARSSAAVLAFKNLSGRAEEAWISTALAEMLSTHLAAGQQLRVVPGESVARMQTDLALPAAASYSAETLSRIRKQVGADVVVNGSYLALGRESGGRLTLDLQMQDAGSGETLAVVSQDGTEADLADLVSRSGDGLRKKLGAGAVTGRDATELRASIPTSPEAARLYAEGLSRLRAFDALAARDLFLRATAVDPDHALSHSALAESWSDLGYDAKAREEAKKALDLSTPLSREERLSIEGRYRELAKDFPAAIEIYRTLSNFFADDLEYALRLANAQLAADRAKDAVETIARMRSLPGPQSQDARIDLTEGNAGDALGDFKRTQRAAAVAAEKAQLQGSRLLLAQAKEREGWAWNELGDSAKAASALAEARELFAASGNPRSSAIVVLDLADVLYDKGDLAGARRLYEEALRLFRQVGAQQKVAVALSRVGSVCLDEGKLQEARRYEEDALRLDREIGAPTARDLGNLANVLATMGDLAGAAASNQQSAEEFGKGGDKSNEGMVLANVAGVLVLQGELGSARQAVDRAMRLQQETGHRRGLGYSLFYLADILLAQDRLDEAQAANKRSVALRRELGDEARLPESQMQLAEITLEQGKAAEAESLARTAAADFDKQKATALGAQSYAYLTRALLAQGKRREAQVAADRAMDLSRRGGDFAVPFEAGFAAAAVKADSGSISEAAAALEGLRGEAGRHGCAGYALEAELALGSLEVRSGKVLAGRARLQRLQGSAREKGFLLVARKASDALRADSSRR